MIKIHTRFSGSVRKSDAFACMVVGADGNSKHCDRVDFSKLEKNEECYRIGGNKIQFDVTDIEVGEILLIFPQIGTATRFYRPNEKANTILLTEQCDQRCIMCSQPPKNNAFTYWDLYYEATLLVPFGETIGISGGEPTLYKKDLFEFLNRINLVRPDLKFHILTNGQHFCDDDLKNLEQTRDYVIWGVPLFSCLPEIHDEIVGKNGAHENLFRSFGTLLESQSRVELRTIILQQNHSCFPQLAKEVSKYFQWIEVWSIMQLENIGYARLNWNEKFVDTSVFFDFVKEAILISNACGIRVQLYNFPHCTVPHDFRHLCCDSISDWKKSYLDECGSCLLRSACCGFFEWNTRQPSFSRIQSLRS